MGLMVIPEVNNLSKKIFILAQATVMKLMNAEQMEFVNLAEEDSMSQNFVIFVQGAATIVVNAGSTAGAMGGQTETINRVHETYVMLLMYY